MGEYKYGETTARFIRFLKENGPQTHRQLSQQSFWGGIRSRIPQLISQGRVEKVTVANPYSSLHSRAAVIAYKVVPGATEKPMTCRGRRVEVTYKERILLEKKARAVARAIILLNEQGYTVQPSIDQED